MRNLFLPTLALGASVIVAGCGTSSTAVAVDSGTSLDGSSAPDAAVDAGPNCHSVGATQSACRSCCATAYAAGSNAFDKYLLTCACGGSFCGAPDGGVADGGVADAGDLDAGDAGPTEAGASDAAATADAGLFGTGVCAATACSATPSQPSADCNTCILASLGSVSAAGPCQSALLAGCLGDPTCNQYLGCVENCP